MLKKKVSLYKVRTFRCLGCGITASQRRSKTHVKYCSLKCYRMSSRPNRKTGKTIECETCRKKTYKIKSLQHPHMFCSSKCANIWQSRNKIKFKCRICKTQFLWPPSRITNQKHEPRYCTIACRNKCPKWKQAHIKANVVQNRKKGLNKLEKAGSVILNGLKIKFKTQFLLFDKFLVDVYLPRSKTVIQWDGEYWHGHPTKLTNGLPDARQIKRIRLDKSQDKYFKKAGLKVLRFWETDVLKRGDKVSEIIRKSVSKTT